MWRRETSEGTSLTSDETQVLVSECDLFARTPSFALHSCTLFFRSLSLSLSLSLGVSMCVCDLLILFISVTRRT